MAADTKEAATAMAAALAAALVNDHPGVSAQVLEQTLQQLPQFQGGQGGDEHGGKRSRQL
eukprot:6899791-Prorocentrum_lima.AAC.1